jgi:hypothetical protein
MPTINPVKNHLDLEPHEEGNSWITLRVQVGSDCDVEDLVGAFTYSIKERAGKDAVVSLTVRNERKWHIDNEPF